MDIEDISQNATQSMVEKITGFPIVDTVKKILQYGKRIRSILSPTGIYEVLNYESTLELKDKNGEFAVFSKREKVRYLQNNIIAYQDQAWGDGEILLNYQSTPGKPVDFYQQGRKTIILISIQNIRHFGDVDEFMIEWGMRHGFLRSRASWETSVDHKTDRLRMNIIFPKNRPPTRVELLEETRRKSTLIHDNNLTKLPDGRWMVFWETSQPRQHERYLMLWNW